MALEAKPIDIGGLSWVDRSEKLVSEFRMAQQDAEAYGFELPSNDAVARAVALLTHIARSTTSTESVDVAVGEDGSVEITVVLGRELIVVAIPPSGTRMEMVVQNWKSGEILAPCTRVSEDVVVQRIERAA